MRNGPPRRRDPVHLYEIRLAVRALEDALAAFDLAGIALKFNADDPDQCFRLADGTVIISESWRERWHREHAAAVVRVDVEKARAHVVIPRVDRLVRRQHLRDLDEREDLEHRGLGPDVDVWLDLTEVVRVDGDLLRSSPPRVLPERAPRGVFTTRRSQGR